MSSWRFKDLSGVELRLLLAETEAERPKSLAGICRKKNRCRDITAALIEKGAF